MRMSSAIDAQHLKDVLRHYANADDALGAQRFFKSAKGQYAEGDIFIGIRKPQLRLACKQFKNLALVEVQKLLDSPIHEHRAAGLIILTLQYPNTTEQQKHSIYEFYLANAYKGRINNWDLVDDSAQYIVGEYLLNRPRKILFELAQSTSLWQRRIAVVSNFAFIKRGDPTTALELAEVLRVDEHDLIQKAVGWLLREVGKRCDQSDLLNFLDKYADEMPRTMLRYSLEHLSSEQKLYYMNLKPGN
jgi:3-methyladenine DNA glycosylase AlkD